MKLEELERVFNDNNEPYEILEITLTMENVHKSPQSMDIDDEEVILKGIFFAWRMKMVSQACRHAIEDGKFYVYEIRHDDDSVGELCEISDRVAVNFAGTFVCEEEIPGITGNEVLINDYNYVSHRAMEER